MDNPLISVVMVDGSFREKFHSIDYLRSQTLGVNNFELIWIEYFDHIKSELLTKLENQENFKYIALHKDDEYHSSYCFNAGIQSARGEIIVIPDADLVFEPDFLERILVEHQKNERLVLYCYRYDEPENLHQNIPLISHLEKSCVLINPSNYGGCISVRKKWLLKINGYEQHPIFSSGFHANGLDIYTRFKVLGLHIMWHPNIKIYHPWHPNTLVYHKKQQLQKILIEDRSLRLAYRAYQGIETSWNVTFPKALEEQIKKSNRINPGFHDLMKRIPIVKRFT